MSIYQLFTQKCYESSILAVCTRPHILRTYLLCIFVCIGPNILRRGYLFCVYACSGSRHFYNEFGQNHQKYNSQPNQNQMNSHSSNQHNSQPNQNIQQTPPLLLFNFPILSIINYSKINHRHQTTQ